MALAPKYLADKSALARFPIPDVGHRLGRLLEDRMIATCALVDLEVLYSSQNLSEYEGVLEERRSLDAAPITPDVMSTAIDLQHELARRGQHRIPLPDLIISAAAKHANLVVLHYDRDFERIAAAGGADHEWIAPPGSL